MTTEKLTWYVARSGGIVAWCLLAFALVWGLLLSSRILGRRSSPAWLLAVHRHVGGLSVLFTAIHVAAVMLDDFVDFGLREVLVPMASEWRPGAVAWGIVGMYLLVAIEGTSLAMRWLPKKLWRGVHWLSAGLFVVATIHGWQSGTDTGRAFMVATVGSIVVLAALTVIRIGRARRNDTTTDRQAVLATLRAKDDSKPGPEEPAIIELVDVELPTPIRPVRSLPSRASTPAAAMVPSSSPSAVALAERPPDVDDGREAGPVGTVWKRRA